MREVQARTLADQAQAGPCWPEIATVNLAAAPRATEVLTVGQHITAARALGPAQPAVLRFLDTISNRRYLPVRILDFGISIEHLIQIVRCEMEDLQFYTLTDCGIPWVNCWLGPFNHFDGNDAGSTNVGATTLEVGP
jgi:hypothetical protein